MKYRPDYGPDLDSSGRLALLRAPLAKSSAAATAHSLKYARSITFTHAELSRLHSKAPADPASRNRFDILRFSGLLYVDLPGADKHRLLDLGRMLESLPEVEYCSLEPTRGAPPPIDLAPPTGDFNREQGWLGPNPGSDCRYGWTKNALGQGVTVRDIEDSWGNLVQGSTHEEFEGADVGYGSPAFNKTYDDHGIAIFGMIVGQHNGFGISGCSPKAAARGYSFQRANGNQDRPGTLARMVADSKPGDVILLEMQTGGADGKLCAADYSQAVWDLIRQATAAGVVVVGTAGNGGANMDASAYAAYRARGDNGVIMEGAGTSTTNHMRLGFSSFGSTVHVQGWGENVVTTGYGDLEDFSPVDNRQSYTRGFSGTSSGGGHVAGIVASVQSYAMQKSGRPLTSMQMRDLLVATGNRQGADSLTGHIGPLPNIRAAIDSIDRMIPTSADPGEGAWAGLSLGDWRLAGGAISATAAMGSEYDVSLVDLSGRTVHRGKAIPSRGQVRIPLENLDKGIYLLTIRGAGKSISRKQILAL